MRIFLLFLMLFSITTGCAQKITNSANPKMTNVKNEVSVQAYAPNIIYIQTENKIKLPIEVRLTNNSINKIELIESNPCAVFRWKLLDEYNQIIQSKPNQLCVQSLAVSTLKPNTQLKKSYEITLNSALYTTGSKYRLVYQFWKYSGVHKWRIQPISATLPLKK
ncbi:hypothetical protein SPONN_942 [uncultured Candidatus Thioglobus sp.]|nr:hypothetical protein SPONN_942 [uncultured Candidatus Thioglobus sp.]